jgi:3-phosphoshikimate 1-carboxyvinyltransferase
MMLAVASCITQEPITLHDAKAIDVSYPTFFDHLALLSK